MARRVFLHVGTPKSGTTYLQTVLWRNAERLKADGLLLPGCFETHYAAAKAVTGRSGQRRETRIVVERAWPRVTNQANRWPADVVISHELFAPAHRKQANEAKAAVAGSELHIVLTARALHHQVPASWQEQIKGGAQTPYEVFISQVREEQAKGAWFWAVQDLVSVAQRWSDDVPPERVHIVTVPPDRTDPSLLWRRYVGLFGLDPLAYDTSAPVKNASLGLIESELLRRIHAVRDERFTDNGRHRWTRKLLATQILARRRGDRLRLPDSTRSWLADRSAQMRQAIEAVGYDVVGDLSDLTQPTTVDTGRSIDSVTASELDEAATWTIARLTEELEVRQPGGPLSGVRPGAGVTGILDLLEHIRALDTGGPVRTASMHPQPPQQRRARPVLRPAPAHP